MSAQSRAIEFQTVFAGIDFPTEWSTYSGTAWHNWFLSWDEYIQYGLADGREHPPTRPPL